MILYIRDPENSNRKPLELIKIVSKVSGYKIMVQKSLAFLYNNKKLSEVEIIDTLQFIMASGKLGINLTEDTKDLYSENFQSLNKEIEDDIQRLKDLP